MNEPPAATPVTDPLAELRQLLVEVREMLVQIRRDQGDARAGARDGPLILGSEQLIRLEDAVALVWGQSAARTPESRQAHAGILELFATTGLNGVVLETTLKRKKWHTSRNAVERFMTRAFGRHPDPEPPTGGDANSRRRGAR